MIVSDSTFGLPCDFRRQSIHAKQILMPTHEGVRLNNMKGLFPEFRKMGKKNEMNTISVG